MDDLSPYDRVTVNLRSRSHAELSRHPEYGHLVETAVHAVLTGLRQYKKPSPLFPAFETEAGADLALIRSLLSGELPDETLWTVRDTAFNLRWVELETSG